MNEQAEEDGKSLHRKAQETLSESPVSTISVDFQDIPSARPFISQATAWLIHQNKVLLPLSKFWSVLHSFFLSFFLPF
jgi:hypothetical protein